MKKSLILSISALIFLGLASLAMAQNYSFNSDLTLGSSGSDVVNLQSWLISNGYSIPSVSSGAVAKGYFGGQTQAALMSYQRSVGLPAYGYFGSMTRERANRGGFRTDNNLQVNSPNGGEVWQKGTVQNISWTGSTGILNQTGDIKLEFAMPACAQPTAPVRCMVAVRAPMTIVKGVNLNSGSYSWIVGNAFDPSIASLPYCATISSTGGCVNPPPSVSDGQYKIQICPTNVNSSSQCDESDNYFNITSNGTVDSQAPFISGIDAPTALTVEQTGTWTIHATDPMNGTLGYTVLWGDERDYATTGGTMVSPQAAAPQTSTFTHSYSTAGVYMVTFTVRNSAGKQVQTSSSVQVTGQNQAGSLKIVSPNGGEIWQKGTVQNITWTSPYYFAFAASTATINLIPYQTPCTGAYACVSMPRVPYTIATNIPINQNSYSWNVGAVIPVYATGYGIASNVSIVPDGQYSIQICQTSVNSVSSNCITSAATFTITSTQTSNLPDINIVSPNGGEVWQAGAMQNMTVDLSGDTSKVGNMITSYLINSSNQQIQLGTNYVYNLPVTGQKTFNVNVPSSVPSGSYKLLVNLYYQPAAATCPNCGVPVPQQQAYDYSDGYFTVQTNPYIVYPYPAYNQCPVGYTCTPNQ